jgi:flagellar motor switch/type III secretory pathway protein FliN
VPVTLPVLLARVESTANELASLRLGDNLLFGDPERPPATLESTRTLCAPTSQRALSLERTAQGWVLRRAVLLDYEPTLEAMRDTDADDTLEGAVLDAPLDVRIEVGSVTMTAAEWLTLRQGDIVATTLPVAGPAVLRVAGREVARGELVNIEGQLGVKLTQLTPAAGS